ncbi:MAG: hypothetical protein E6G41_00235 [Actinobacteria bacterium]|nr:MAG: hypothetical protein E6G41_00235 [Actinomycetota bacterium]
MRARCAAYAVAAVVGAPASASATDVAVDQPCYAQGRAMEVSGSGYTPNSIATLTVGGTTTSADTDATGAFTTSLSAPMTALELPGAVQFTLAAHDVDSGADTSTTINVARVGVDALPRTAKPHARITWYLAGFPSQKAIYGHWRFGGKTRANHRMGFPSGPCGVLTAKARQIEAKRIRFGTWTVQFDHNRVYDKHAQPSVIAKVRVSRTFAKR